MKGVLYMIDETEVQGVKVLCQHICYLGLAHMHVRQVVENNLLTSKYEWSFTPCDKKCEPCEVGIPPEAEEDLNGFLKRSKAHPQEADIAEYRKRVQGVDD